VRDATIRLQELDGTWQTLGTDRASGITAEGLSLTSNSYGPDGATFELHRDPDAAWPDLAAFTPVEIDVANQLAWSGRIAETQIQDGSTARLSVRCEGWQYHLDDDQVAKTYVNRKLSDWKDLKEFVPVVDDWVHQGTVEITDGNIWMGWKAGTTPKTGQMLGIVLDLGAQESYSGFTFYLTGKAHQESLLYPLTGTHTGGYLLTTGVVTSTYVLNTHTPPYWISGTAYTNAEIVIDGAAGTGKCYQANKTIPIGNRALNPGSNSADWNEIYGPLWLYAGSAKTETNLANVGNTTGSTFGSTYSPTFGYNTGYSNAGAWMVGSTTSAKDVKNFGLFLEGYSARSRYAVLVLRWSTVNAAAPLVNNYGYNITGLTTYGDATYAQGYPNTGTFTDITTGLTSSMKASDPIKDAVKIGAPMLTTTGVQKPTTSLQDFRTDGYKTPREIIDQANSYHGWIARVGADRDLTYKPLPTAPKFELGAWSGYDFEDQAASTTEDVYTRVIVEATGPDGNMVRVARSAAQLANAATTLNGSSTLTTDQIQTLLVRATTPTDIALGSTSASGKGGCFISASGVFRAGVSYRIAGQLGCNGTIVTATIGDNGYTTVSYPSGYTVAATYGSGNATNAWSFTFIGASVGQTAIPFVATWTPDTDQSFSTGFITVTSSGGSGSDSSSIDSVTLQALGVNLADRRGLRRTYVLSAPGIQTKATLAAIGDAWLYQHLRSQFRGSVNAVGPAAIRQASTGDPVHPSRLLLEAGEIVRLTDRVDPDTGQIGRDARISAVSYDHDNQRVTVELDNRRDNLQTFLNRLAVV
jgi:hypothetical protein